MSETLPPTVHSPLMAASAARPVHRRSRGGPVRRVVRALSTVLIVTGALLLADAGLTLVWQEPFSALYAHYRQGALGTDLGRLDARPPSSIDAGALAHLHLQRLRIAFLARSLERHAPEGSAVGRIDIPHIHARYVLIKGTNETDLKSGPGIYPQTHFPGVPGTTAIAGHRTTYLAPFRHVDALRRGDRILVTMPYAEFTYTVTGERIVAPTDVGVIDPVGYARVVLSACNPLYSAAQRIIVFGRLTQVSARGAALRT